MYLSRYLQEFKSLLSVSEQKRALRVFQREKRRKDNGVEESNDSELESDDDSNSSIDSTNSAYLNGVTHHESYMIACHNWTRVLSHDVKLGWRQRANMLNMRPLPGKFDNIPREIGGDINNELKKNIVDSLTIEWEKIYKIMRRCIIHAPKASLSPKIMCFGPERVKLNSQTFRKFMLSNFLRLCIFGCDYTKLFPCEVKRKTNRVVLVHVASQSRISKLFTLEGRCATEFEMPLADNVSLSTRTCSGKVNIVWNNKNIAGYILDDVGCRWKVQMANNKVVWMRKLYFDNDNMRYEYCGIHRSHKK